MCDLVGGSLSQQEAFPDFFFTWMQCNFIQLLKNENFKKMIELDSITPSEIEQALKVKYNVFPFICGS